MAKTTIRYICQNCGAESLRWMGKCANCGEWNTLVEETVSKQEKYKGAWVKRSTPLPLTEISTVDEPRFSTGSKELDRVLGGGLVPGCLGLIGGDPGIGKSTLLLQVAGSVAQHTGSVLYVTGEESLTQLKLRAERLGIAARDLTVVSESHTGHICSLIEEERPKLVIVDSIQTMFVDEVPSPPGSVGQVRESTGRFLQAAKGTGTAVLLVGHVTKGGSLAGPKVLEHAVDFVLYFEGESHTSFRIIRSVKNRFGSTHEVGIFEMTEAGLQEVSNPSQMLLAQRPTNSSGSVVVPCLEGTRPLLVEVQALVAPAHFGGPPRRQTTGVDYQRFSIILAVLEKRCGYALQTQDVFVNVAGGIRLEEPAVDLGIAVAVASSDKNCSIDPYCAVIGEIGLSGEIRAVRGISQRLHELARLGFKKCIIPKPNITGSEPLEVAGVSTIQEALSQALGSRR
ncbi:MAG TPA: DNA repair protein RadA [Firmicutes bacterium]|nr:MAG: DNA repair protein RadA [Peptococcaceae bacterium 1109]HHT73152.1 DNA repair protein RadA [Bacillota bacterium]